MLQSLPPAQPPLSRLPLTFPGRRRQTDRSSLPFQGRGGRAAKFTTGGDELKNATDTDNESRKNARPADGMTRRRFMAGTGTLCAGIGVMGLSSCGRKGAVINRNAAGDDADFIIIGSGHNSLACAMMLSRAGHKVLILEEADTIGGAAKTREITLPGFRHDLYSTNIGLFMGSPLFGAFRDELQAHGFRPVVSDFPVSSLFPDETGIGIYRDAGKTHESLSRFSRKDADAWTSFQAYFNRCAPLFLPLFHLPMPSFSALRQVWRITRKLGMKQTWELAQLLLKSPREYGEYLFEHPKSRALLAPWAMHLDFGPEVSGGATFPFVEPPTYQAFGMPLSKGGVGNMIRSMAAVVKRYGGVIETGRKVERILVKNGQAVGVLAAGGQKIHARKSVIANVTPHQLVNRLLPRGALPSEYVGRCRKYRFGPGTMMIHLALDGPAQWAAGDEFGRFNYVHIAPFVEDLSRTYADAVNGCLPASPMLVVGQLSVTDPTRAPRGKHLLWIQVRILPSRPRADAVSGKDAIAPGPWSRIKEAYADRVLKKLEQYAPGVTDKILKRVVLSPADLEKDDPNLAGGDSLAGSHHLDQFYMFRPIPGWSRYRTPVKGLYMVGAATWPGAGLHATSGFLLGKDLLDLY